MELPGQEGVGISHGVHLHMTSEIQQMGRHSSKIMSRLVYEIMLPSFEGWKTVSPIERAKTMVCLNPKLNVFLVYNTFNVIVAVQKQVKYKLRVFES